MTNIMDNFNSEYYGAQCETCKSVAPTYAEIKHKATIPMPSVEEMMDWDNDGGCEATDGCWVEPDGKCEHGHLSWMRRLGFI